MLLNIMKEIEKSTGLISLSELSRRLAIDPGVLDGMLEHWVHKGRIQRAPQGYAACTNSTCSTTCKACRAQSG